MISKLAQAFAIVVGHPIVSDVSHHLAAESSPYFLEIKTVFYATSPCPDFLEFTSKAFSASFQFRNDEPLSSLTKIKGKTQEIEGALLFTTSHFLL
ncbi:hypothetical protein [uncultured Desulfobacter sp.]|uniref:hypothetical protein n=1 Tax=uncultured Desulfobacter sp. TaxID=240139 RepID=UPI002AAAC090|nr:hypothetical protein [uncultured Desulfobacter sp.]